MSFCVRFLVAWRDNAKNNILGVQCNPDGVQYTAVYVLDHVSLPPSTPNVSFSNWTVRKSDREHKDKFLVLKIRRQRPENFVHVISMQYQCKST